MEMELYAQEYLIRAPLEFACVGMGPLAHKLRTSVPMELVCVVLESLVLELPIHAHQELANAEHSRHVMAQRTHVLRVFVPVAVKMNAPEQLIHACLVIVLVVRDLHVLGQPIHAHQEGVFVE